MALVGRNDGDRWQPLPQQGRGPLLPHAQKKEPSPQQQPVFKVIPQPQAPAPTTVAQAIGTTATQVGTGFGNRPVVVMPEQPALAVQIGPKPVSKAEADVFGQPLPVQLEVKKQVEAQRANALAQAEAYDRQAAMGERDRLRREREKNDRTERMRNMTLAQWNAYNPLQQAAVQANADLYDAIQADLAAQSQHGRVDEEGRRVNDKLDAYRGRANELFGTEGQLGVSGLEFAPNTIAFLDSRGIDRGALAGRTLDDIILGDTLFTKGVIDNLGKDVTQPTFQTGQKLSQRDSNIAFAQKIAAGQLAYQEKLAATLKKGEALLSGMTSGGTAKLATDTYGAKEQENGGMTKLTAVRPETIGQIDKYMEALARPEMDPAESMSVIELDLQQRGASQEEIDQVYRSMQERVRLGMQDSSTWFPNVDYTLRSPAEVGRTLQLPTLKRAEG